MATAIFYPVLAQCLLTFILLLQLAVVRRKALKARETTTVEIALDDRPWPDYARKVANCYSNQFELPVIFYVLCFAALETGAAGSLMVLLAWAFVVSRIAHAYIFTTSNQVRRRGLAFAVGFLIALAMAALILGHLLFSLA